MSTSSGTGGDSARLPAAEPPPARVLPALRAAHAAVLPTALRDALVGLVVATTSAGPVTATAAAVHLVDVLVAHDPGPAESTQALDGDLLARLGSAFRAPIRAGVGDELVAGAVRQILRTCLDGPHRAAVADLVRCLHAHQAAGLPPALAHRFAAAVHQLATPTSQSEAG